MCRGRKSIWVKLWFRREWMLKGREMEMEMEVKEKEVNEEE
jgi:hypothetical protein